MTAVGAVMIVIVEVVTEVLPHAFVAVNVYMPADVVEVVIAAGLSTVDEKPPGPAHE